VVEAQRVCRAEDLHRRLAGDYAAASVTDLQEILRCRKVDLGLGRIVALCDRPSTLL
jgi:hypothetical protein